MSDSLSRNRDAADKAIRLCQKHGAEQSEVLIIHQEEKAASVFDQQVQLSGMTESARISVRIFQNHRGAVVFGQGFSEKLLEDLIKQAFGLMRETSADKYFGAADANQLESPASDLKIYDERLARLPLRQIEEVALAAEQAVARRDSRVRHLITSNLQVQTQTVALCTSLGVNQSYKATTATLVSSAVTDNNLFDAGTRDAEDWDRNLIGTSTIITRSLDGLNLERNAERTLRRLTGMTDAKPAPHGDVPVVFAPSAARGITTMLLQLCSGPAAMFLEASYLGKLGESVCSSQVTLIDDATKEGGIGTVQFDHEGVPPRRKSIIQQGVLNEYLLNSYYGRALQRYSTGNAVANGDARFGVRPSNAYIQPGDSNPDDIIASIRRGLYVTRFLSYSMALATNFTQAAEGFWIEDGKLTHPVQAAAISTPLQEMLKNIVAVGNDFDGEVAIGSPTLLVSKMTVSPLI